MRCIVQLGIQTIRKIFSMVIVLNILAFIFLLFLVKSPNKGITPFQFMLPSIVIVVDNIVEATYNPAYLSTAWFQILFGCNILLWLFIGVSSDSQESASYKIDNKFNFISEPYIVLNFPWGKYDFSKVALNQKFIIKYYELQNKSRNFSEFLTFTYLKEYFYFKSVLSFHLVAKEKNHRKDY